MKTILIDDELFALQYLEYQLSDIEGLQIIGKFKDPIAGKEAIETNDVDLVFLDIHIPRINGLELAELLLENKPDLQIVFITAHHDYAIRAFELNALDYILKPVTQKRLLNTVQRALNRKTDSPPTKETGILHMNLFQQGSIFDEEGEPLTLRWRTAKVQQLFFYLVQHRGQIVHKTELVELLWWDLELDKAFQQLYSAVYNMRKTLAPYTRYFKIERVSEGYILTLKHIKLDVDQFERLIQSDLPLNEETIRDYEEAADLVNDDYLQGYDYIWTENERQRLQVQWLQLSYKIIAWHYSQQEWEKATARSLDVCSRYPLEEEASLWLMKIFAAKGKRASVHQQYVRLKELMQSELLEQPSLFITEWYEQWKQDNKEGTYI
ncbi:hypothetical protein J27TS8_33350 [Robertmurraya siralis]|uniref:Response regulator n=1 Tax=Robertmurraya siralis TaxID=77777 RepID=A0A919WKH6_9BACI|nr:response regulator [Robertmurraya siralis]GIN63342.1 hypothetical protein J27TS8_33350 [Robertmurraya siralis]